MQSSLLMMERDTQQPHATTSTGLSFVTAIWLGSCARCALDVNRGDFLIHRYFGFLDDLGPAGNVGLHIQLGMLVKSACERVLMHYRCAFNIE